MSEIKDYDKQCKILDNIRVHSLEMLDNISQNEVTKKLRQDILDCNNSSRLIELTTEILNLQYE